MKILLLAVVIIALIGGAVWYLYDSGVFSGNDGKGDVKETEATTEKETEAVTEAETEKETEKETEETGTVSGDCPFAGKWTAKKSVLGIDAEIELKIEKDGTGECSVVSSSLGSLSYKVTVEGDVISTGDGLSAKLSVENGDLIVSDFKGGPQQTAMFFPATLTRAAE